MREDAALIELSMRERKKKQHLFLVQGGGIVETVVAVQVKRVQKSPFRGSDIHIAFPDDARSVDEDFALDLPVPVHLSVNLNTTTQIPNGSDFVTILKNDAGTLKHVFQGKV